MGEREKEKDGEEKGRSKREGEEKFKKEKYKKKNTFRKQTCTYNLTYPKDGYSSAAASANTCSTIPPECYLVIARSSAAGSCEVR